MRQRHNHKKGFELLRSNSETIAHKTRMGFNLSSSNSKAVGQPCKGFSLVEAAIVLGVVGLVVGGIWYAAATMIENQKVNRLVSGVIVGAEKLRNLVTPADYVNPVGSGWVHLDNLCVNAKIFPDFPIVNGKIQNPFGSVLGAIYGSSQGIGVSCSLYLAQWIIISTPLPTAGLCQKVISGITARFKDNTELDRVWIVGDDNTIRGYTTFPIPPNGTQCSGLVTPISISLFFTMKRRN